MSAYRTLTLSDVKILPVANSRAGDKNTRRKSNTKRGETQSPAHKKLHRLSSSIDSEFTGSIFLFGNSRKCIQEYDFLCIDRRCLSQLKPERRQTLLGAVFTFLGIERGVDLLLLCRRRLNDAAGRARSAEWCF